MSVVFYKNLEKALKETENMGIEEIVKYCRRKLNKNSTDRACHRWERIRDVLIRRYELKEKCEFKVGDKVHWINNGEINKKRTDVITEISFDIWNDLRIKTVEVNNADKRPKRGVAYPEYLVLAK